MDGRAKIVYTLGPVTSSYEAIRGLVCAGMDVARLNSSHGAYAQHEEAYRWVRQASDESGRGVGVLVDLQGPKIRPRTFADLRWRGRRGRPSRSPPTSSRAPPTTAS